MLIQVLLCDHCEAVSFGGRFEAYKVEGGPVLHICEVCQRKPFRRVQPSSRGLAVAAVIQMALGDRSELHVRNHES
jgi:hypothetical protein